MSQQDRDLPIRSIMDSLRRIFKELRSAARRAEKRTGFAPAQKFVLQQLKSHEPLSMNELAERTYSHQSTVSVVVDRLVKMGYIKKDIAAQDARRLELRLTSRGRNKMKGNHQTVQEHLIEGLNQMTRADQQQLASLLALFVSNMGLAQEIPDLFFEEKPRSSVKRRRRN